MSSNNNIRAFGWVAMCVAILFSGGIIVSYHLHRASQIRNEVIYTVMRVEPTAILISEHKVVDAYRLYITDKGRRKIIECIVPCDVTAVDENLPFDTAMWNQVKLSGRSYTLVRWHPKFILPREPEPATEQNFDDPPFYYEGGS